MRPTLAAVLLAASIAPVARSEIVEFDFESMPGNSDSAGGDFTALFLNAGDLYAVITRTSGERFTVWNSEGRDVPAFDRLPAVRREDERECPPALLELRA